MGMSSYLDRLLLAHPLLVGVLWLLTTLARRSSWLYALRHYRAAWVRANPDARPAELPAWCSRQLATRLIAGAAATILVTFVLGRWSDTRAAMLSAGLVAGAIAMPGACLVARYLTHATFFRYALRQRVDPQSTESLLQHHVHMAGMLGLTLLFAQHPWLMGGLAGECALAALTWRRLWKGLAVGAEKSRVDWAAVVSSKSDVG